jgi:hypothetical protein
MLLRTKYILKSQICKQGIVWVYVELPKRNTKKKESILSYFSPKNGYRTSQHSGDQMKKFTYFRVEVDNERFNLLS